MAASRFIEEESGSYTNRILHPHNGYYAGDFSEAPRSGSDRVVRVATVFSDAIPAI